MSIIITLIIIIITNIFIIIISISISIFIIILFMTKKDVPAQHGMRFISSRHREPLPDLLFGAPGVLQFEISPHCCVHMAGI